MADTNGRTADGDFSNIELSTYGEGGSQSSARGPWTHSTDSYSRTVPQNITTKVTRNNQCIAATVCAIAFVIGVGLGMVIGIFAIQPCGDEPVNGPTSPSAEMVAQTTPPTTAPQRRKCSTSPISSSPPTPECSPCASRNPDKSSGNEHLASPFAALSQEEINKAISVMVNFGNASYGSRLTDNRISHVYLYPNKKSNVLNYLDREGEFPGRYAKVHVFRGSRVPPDVMEYKVGPLHKSEDQVSIEQLRIDGEINFNRRPYDKKERELLDYTVDLHIKTIRKLLEESFDGKYYKRDIYINFAFMPAYNESVRISSAYLYLKMGGYSTIRILPVTCRIYHPGTDYKKWRVTDFYYLSQGPFGSAQELQNAYDTGNLRKTVFPSGYFELHKNEFDLKLNTSMPNRPLSNIPPPKTYEPEGPRYTIKGSRISWMDWELDFTSDSIRGPAIFDVRFKGNRIAYEISLQDVTLLYASQSNGAGPPVISDTIFFLGNSNPPHLDLDCPNRAKLIVLSMYVYGMPKRKPYACVFEADGQDPSWKYQSLGISNHYLIIRASMNLGNYEYSVEWRLYLDGHLETLISASGFLYGAFWDKDDPFIDIDKSTTPFGYRLSEYVLGPIHDHAYAFKVDVDILGEDNSLEILHWKTGDVLNALNTQTNVSEVPGYFPFNNTRYITYDLLEREKEFVLNPLKPKYFTIVNEKEKNIWGVKRGYRIIPHSQGAENFDDHVMFRAWGHLKYNLAVTRRKDSEPYATNSLYDITHPLNAFEGVGNMLDNETVRSKDLVLWVTEKFYHAPSSEDLPMTLKVQRGFTLKPFNFFDRTPTFDIRGYYQDSLMDPYSIGSCFISKHNPH